MCVTSWYCASKSTNVQLSCPYVMLREAVIQKGLNADIIVTKHKR